MFAIAFVDPALERGHVVVGHILRIRRIVRRLARVTVGNGIVIGGILLTALVLICRHSIEV